MGFSTWRGLNPRFLFTVIIVCFFAVGQCRGSELYFQNNDGSYLEKNHPTKQSLNDLHLDLEYVNSGTRPKTLSASTYIYVDADAEDAPQPDSSHCESGATEGKCNLRSAIASVVCNLFPNDNIGHKFIIVLPEKGDVYINTSISEMQLLNTYCNLEIIGNGATIHSLSGNDSDDPSLRFLSLQITEDRIPSLRYSFWLSNVTIKGFGNAALGGGALLVVQQFVYMENVVFEENTGDVGGAVCCDRCHAFQATAVKFMNNSAASDGGGVFLTASSLVAVAQCDFIGNTVGKGQGNYGTGSNRGINRDL